MYNKTHGFTLIELLVVMSVMATLASAIIFATIPVREQARDGQRQADVRMIEVALTLYKQKYGRYPERCSNGQAWSGQVGTTYACSSGNRYIVDLAPEFIPELPRDPSSVSGNAGYVYTTNSDGSVYKFMVKNTVESDAVTVDHPFRSCSDGCNPSISHCQSGNSQFRSSYAVWGGLDTSVSADIRDNTDQIICDIP